MSDVTAPDSRWAERAACRGLHPAAFVPPDLVRKPPPVVVTCCPSCPVSAECLAHGRATHAEGWWGGRLLRKGTPVRLKRQVRTRRAAA